MAKIQKRTAIDVAAETLREIILATEDGTFVGSEDTLISRVECSRSTMRQAARLLEREGLLKVRRGINGGYFATRPDAGTIEATVSTYLSTLDIDSQDVTLLASALWVEAMRKAASADRGAADEMVSRLRKRLKSIKDAASFEQIRDVELETQEAIFALTDSQYVKLIFDINAEFSRRRFHQPKESDGSHEHLAFVSAWRDAKLMELKAIMEGDRDLAVMAARHSRKIWHQRVYSRLIASPDTDRSAAV
jgi:DNA-binding FadR family transcriptional regulator